MPIKHSPVRFVAYARASGFPKAKFVDGEGVSDCEIELAKKGKRSVAVQMCPDGYVLNLLDLKAGEMESSDVLPTFDAAVDLAMLPKWTV